LPGGVSLKENYLGLKMRDFMSENVSYEASRGVLSTNRPPAISHSDIVQNREQIIGSEDTVTLSLYVHWEEKMFKALSECFDEMKEAAQAGNHEKDYIELSAKSYLFSATGYKSGTGAGPMYRWKMECDGVKISIANQPIPQNGIPNAIVNIGSLYLMKNGGLLQGWPGIKGMVEAFCGKIELVKISRLDGCIDLVDVDVAEYVSRFENNYYISRAQKGGVFNHGKRKTGFKLGTGKQIRVYDKRQEVEHQPEKMLILVQTRWGGRLPEYATRVEFQIGSEDLRILGIATLDDYEQKRYSLFEYLTHEWFRMTDAAPTQNNHSRLATSGVWEIVQGAFKNWTGKRIASLKFTPDKLPDQSHLSKQAIGCIDSMIALRDIQFEDMETLKHHLKAEFAKAVESEDLESILKKTDYKRRRFNSLGRVLK
jgi:hypothetical protein